MGESACLMHSYNYAPGTSNEANHQGNPMPSLGESISFGRFMTESLSWEKWSTFSHRRYVEEAERYAQPGSVAQKKAFFEAHYKKIAAKKAAEEAALLEQANSSNTNQDPEPEEGQSCDLNTTSAEIEPKNMEEAESEKKEDNQMDYSKEMNQSVSDMEMEKPLLEGNDMDYSKKKEEINQSVFHMAEMEKPLLEDFKSSQDASKTLVQQKIPKVPALPPIKYRLSVHCKKETKVTPITKSITENISISKSQSKIPVSPAKPSILVHNRKEWNSSLITRKTLAEPIDGNRKTSKQLPKVPISPAKNTVLVHSKKQTNSTPITRKTLAEAIKENTKDTKLVPKILASPAKSVTRKTWESPVVNLKDSAAKSLRTLIYSTPTREMYKSTDSAAKKPESSRVAFSSSRASKDCKTPLRSPFMDFTKGDSKKTSAAPCSENKRTRAPPESPASGSKTTGPKWHILAAVCSRPMSAHKNKLQSPTLSVPFNLRTEERAARRKQKLEEKFNEKATPKLQLQTRIKEKAENELRKLRRSLCFRARPLPEFYKEKETPKNQIEDPKITRENPEAPKLGRKPTFTTAKSVASLYPNSDTHSTKSLSNVVNKTRLPKILTSFPENTSPNIQYVSAAE